MQHTLRAAGRCFAPLVAINIYMSRDANRTLEFLNHPILIILNRNLSLRIIVRIYAQLMFLTDMDHLTHILPSSSSRNSSPAVSTPDSSTSMAKPHTESSKCTKRKGKSHLSQSNVRIQLAETDKPVRNQECVYLDTRPASSETCQ
jgi:hypothetical protein